MKVITVYVRTNKINSQCEMQIEVEDDATEDEIEEQAQEVMYSMMEWGWSEGGE